jgi:hypothetical protein
VAGACARATKFPSVHDFARAVSRDERPDRRGAAREWTLEDADGLCIRELGRIWFTAARPAALTD